MIYFDRGLKSKRESLPTKPISKLKHAAALTIINIQVKYVM